MGAWACAYVVQVIVVDARPPGVGRVGGPDITSSEKWARTLSIPEPNER